MARGRVWRRFQRQSHMAKLRTCRKAVKSEKKWRMLYLRSEKLHRAKQLRIDYPRISGRQLLDKELDLELDDEG